MEFISRPLLDQHATSTIQAFNKPYLKLWFYHPYEITAQFCWRNQRHSMRNCCRERRPKPRQQRRHWTNNVHGRAAAG